MRRALAIVAVLGLPLAAGPAAAKDWWVLESPHHRIYATPELREFALEVSRAAEALAQPIAVRYGYDQFGDRTTWVLHDDAEWFNGAAYTLINHIELYNTTADFDLRGTTPWVPNVVAHEFAHLATIDRAKRYPRWIGGLIFGAIDEWNDLSGFGTLKGGVSWFLPPDRVPRWFSEGIAQAEARREGVDAFDTTRRMLERMAWAEDGLMSAAEMGSVQDKTFFGGEQVYNQGMSLTMHLAQRHGPESLLRLLDHEAAAVWVGFDRALERTYGMPVDVLMAGWRADVAARAVTAIAALPWIYEGERYYTSGPYDRRPALSPDGRTLAWTGDGESDYPLDRLVFAPVDRPDEQTEAVDGVASRPAWHPSGDYVVVAKSHRIPAEDRSAYDLMKVNVADGESEWLSNDGIRAQWPAIHPGGTTLAVAIRGSGAWDLATMPVSGPPLTIHTDLPFGWQLRELAFAPDGTLWGALVHEGEIDLFRAPLPAMGQPLTVVTVLDWPGSEERSPQVAGDGTLWFSGDRLGSFQIYALDPTDGTLSLRTGALGGALEAAPGATAAVVTVYHHHDYRLHRIPTTRPTHVTSVTDGRWRTIALPNRAPVTAPMAGFARARFRLAPPIVYPEFQYLYGDPSAGAVVFLSDDLREHNLELEGIFGRTSDINAAYLYRGWPPQIEVNLSRYWSDLELDLQNGSVLPLPFFWDSLRVQSLYDPWPEWLFGLSLSGDRLTFTNVLADQLRGITFGDDYARLRRLDATALAQWARLERRSRNDIDLRGTVAFASLSVRRSRVGTPDFTSNVVDVVDVPHMRSLADVQWAAGKSWFTGELGLRGGFIDRDVDALDEFFLGGTIFSLRRGELRSYNNLPGYDDFAISGEKLLTAHAAARAMVATDLGGVGPLLFDALLVQLTVEAGNAWPHDLGFKQLFQGLLDRPAAEGLRPSNAASLGIAPDDPRFAGLLYDAVLDVRLKTILYDFLPWNSFVRVAHGFRDRTLVVDPATGVQRFRDTQGVPIRVYVGLGTGF